MNHLRSDEPVRADVARSRSDAARIAALVVAIAAPQPLLAATLADHPRVRHIKIADASGRPLGRSFKVKLWPTLIFLSDGQEVARLVRPDEAGAVREALAQIDNAAQGHP